MGEMALGYGSEFHLLRWVGRHREKFNKKVYDLLGIDEITWLDFNFNKNKSIPDEEIRGIDFLSNNKSIINTFKNEWPQSGNLMNWDLIGYSKSSDTWILCEAKAHIGELRSDCKALSADSLNKINNSIKITKEYFKIENDIDWTRQYYQFANRLYSLGLLKRHGLNAFLLNIYFVGDIIEGNIRQSPQDKSEWDKEIKKMYETMGIGEDIKYVKNLFLGVYEEI